MSDLIPAPPGIWARFRQGMRSKYVRVVAFGEDGEAYIAVHEDLKSAPGLRADETSKTLLEPAHHFAGFEALVDKAKP